MDEETYFSVIRCSEGTRLLRRCPTVGSSAAGQERMGTTRSHTPLSDPRKHWNASQSTILLAEWAPCASLGDCFSSGDGFEYKG